MNAMTTQPVKLGQAIPRVDGKAKVTGAAKYAADYALPSLHFAVIVHTTVAKGKLTSLETAAARKAAGVVAVLDAGNIAEAKFAGNRQPFRKAGDDVDYIGQPIAVVVAQTFEQARFAASLVKADYERQQAVTSMLDPAAATLDANARGGPNRGNPESALSSAAVKLSGTYETPIQTHHPMELGATVAVWNGDKLTIYDGTQAVLGSRKRVADAFGLPTADVTIVSPYIGGGFGARLLTWPHTYLAAAAARMIGKPVKLVLTRQQMSYAFGHRPASRQELTLGATSDGKLSVISQNTLSSTGVKDDFVEPVTGHTLVLYDHQHSGMQAKAARLNIGAPAPMRAPGAPLGLFALEVAMDELAEQLKIDPVELRLMNDTAVDPRNKKPYTDRNFAECLKRGAAKIGWADRAATPKQKRAGDWLIGYGVGCCAWHGGNTQATARVRVLRDGSAVVASAAQDMGTGTYTVMAQAVAEVLCLPMDKVSAEIGVSTLPPAPTAGGSRHCSSVVPAAHQAATAAKKKLLELAMKHEKSPLAGLAADQLQFNNGTISSGTKSITLGDLVALTGEANIEVTEEYKPDGKPGFVGMNFGAHFCQVAVHAFTGETRVKKFASVFDCGRIFNLHTAANQLSGGVVWGIGMALTEAAHLDSSGRYAAADFSGYHIPSHADIPNIDVEMINKPDKNFGALGSRGGVGELAISGVAAAISNAVYNATGKRVREVPITPDKLI